MPSNKRDSRAEFRERLNRAALRPPRHLAQASRRPPDMFHRPYMYRRYHRSHRRRRSHSSHRCRRSHRFHMSRRSHRSPRAIAVRVGEMLQNHSEPTVNQQ